MIVEVKVPAVGESVTEGLLAQWQVEDGSIVQADDPLFELETDKVTLEVNAEKPGRIEFLARPGDAVEVGQVVAKIDTDSAPGAVGKAPGPAPEKARETAQQEDSRPKDSGSQPGQASSGKKLAPAEERRGRNGPKQPWAEAGREEPAIAMPPSVRRLVRQHGLDPQGIASSSGRLSRGDVMRQLEKAQRQEPAPQPGPEAPSERQTRQKMSPLRRRMAQRLVQAQHNAAISTTFNEADMSNVLAWRARHKEAFEKRHGVRLGLMSFFVKAAVEALGSVPEVNRQIEGDELVQNHFYDIGVAVSSEKGLLVPVIRNADQLGFAAIEKTLQELAWKVRHRRIDLSDLTGGVFTISNGGVFGSLLSTPILNPPQSGVLGMHAIQKRPVAVGNEVQLRPMMYLALSYDHRVVDGREAVTFLRRIVECIEDPERLLLQM
ncbi:MAG: 2-oxoglutarate dehydrogenase complex dihydrolipoyllysine-residue succinyltransferase [Acidobacteriota bacterium]